MEETEHGEFMVILKVTPIQDDPENPWSVEELAAALFHSPVSLVNKGWSFDAEVLNMVDLSEKEEDGVSS